MLKIYLDSCCYNRPFDRQVDRNVKLETMAKLCIQDRVRSGIHHLVWSFILDAETEDNPSQDKRERISAWRLRASEYCAVCPDVLLGAQRYMQIGLKIKDALHLSSAVRCGCDYLITTDRKFHNKNKLVDGIEIVNPMEFVEKVKVPDDQ